MAARIAGERGRVTMPCIRINPGDGLVIGGARAGVYGYLHLGGGIATAPVMGSRAAHLAARIGARLAPGRQPPGRVRRGAAQWCGSSWPSRCEGGEVRLLAVPQTALFAAAERASFEATHFRRDPRGNRQGVRLAFEGAPFLGAAGLSLVSEVVQPGDMQLTGDGAPYVLLAECQTTGGYPADRYGPALRPAPRGASRAGHGAAVPLRHRERRARGLALGGGGAGRSPAAGAAPGAGGGRTFPISSAISW
jgi:5-oxoprolinase (ATP-hydrolysing) subunit C